MSAILTPDMITRGRILARVERDPSLPRIEALTMAIFRLMEQHRVTSTEFVAAVADAVAITAATLDKEVEPMELNDRLHIFCERVETKYVQVLAVMEKHNWSTE